MTNIPSGFAPLSRGWAFVLLQRSSSSRRSPIHSKAPPMPSATITLVGRAPTPAQRQQLFQRTADLMVEVLKRTRNLVVVSLKHEQCENWSVGGSQLPNVDSIGAQVTFQILEGSNTEEQMAEMVAAMTAMLSEVLGPNPLPPYVIFEQIPTYAWGYKGRTIADMRRAKQ